MHGMAPPSTFPSTTPTSHIPLATILTKSLLLRQLHGAFSWLRVSDLPTTLMFTLISNLAWWAHADTDRHTATPTNVDHLMGYLFPGLHFSYLIPTSLLPCSPASRIAVILPPRVHHPHPPFPLWRAVLVLRTCLCRFMAAFCCLMIPLGTICTLWLFTGRRHPVSPIHNHPGPSDEHPSNQATMGRA